MRKEIIDYFRNNKDEMIKSISELVGVPSVRGEAKEGMPFGEKTAEVLELALKTADGFGFKTENHGGYVGTVDLNGGDTELAILAHLDVVPAGEGWDTDPYTVVEKDGKILGRGVSDDKGPAVAALYAMKAVRELDLPVSKNCRLILGTDEECGSSDLKYYFSKNPYPKYAFTPDANFPVTNGEKGRFTKSFYRTVDFSDCEKYIKSFNAGEAKNAVPTFAKAELVGVSTAEFEAAADNAKFTGADFSFDGETVVCTGTAAHASLPENGNNPITALIELLSNIEFDEKCSDFVADLKALFPHGKYSGEAFGVEMSDMLGSLTLTLDIISFEDGNFEGCFDTRTPMSATKENCADVIAAKLEAHGFAIENTEMIRAHYVDESSDFIKTLLRAYEDYSGDKGECISMGGGTYVHNIENGVAFGAISRDTVTNMHGANEFMPIDDLLTAAAIFTDVIAEICK